MQLAQRASGPRWRVGTNKEVVLCAGAIGTPQLLMLSGIGPRRELEGMKIEVVKELDYVGKNLLDVGRVFLFIPDVSCPSFFLLNA